MKEEKKMPTIDDWCKELENRGNTKLADQLRQSRATSRMLNPLLADSLPKEMNEKLTVFRTPAISECIIFDFIENISNIVKE